MGGRLELGAIGSFVAWDNGIGVGRLAAVEADGQARVRYFRCPSSDPYVERLGPADGLRPATLPQHTRVYLRDGRRWRIGRIDGEHPDVPGTYLIALPNGDGEILESEAFEVRWTLAIENPFEVLAVLGCDSPAVYEPRLAVISAWHRQRAAGLGAAGLVQGSVELHDHQLTVVRNVAADATRRYLLADEVGLGKTIEAGALVWRRLLEQPSSRVLVIAPDHLRSQWAEELTQRYRVGDFDECWLRVRAHDAPSSWPDERVDLLVVDEAHHLTRAGTTDEGALSRLAGLAHGADEVLLLSATPVRSNEAAFLDLLHLLDPANYPLDDLPGFLRRVELRDELALTFQSLLPDLDAFDLSLFGEELEVMFPADALLADLIKAAVETEDAARPDRIRQVREHLSETYRLHHRLLRTRRSGDIEASFRVRGRRRGRPFTVEIDDESAPTRVGLLDEFRGHLGALVETEVLSPAEAVDAFADLASRCGSLPQAVLGAATADPDGLLARWLEGQGSSWSRQISAAAEVVTERLAALLVERTLAKSAGKVVVVSAYSESAGAVAEALVKARGPARVAVHLATRDREENVEDVRRWIDDPICTVLVCDPSAEEGINLQTADVMVHLDLPWDPFRIEQRIGRADRFTERDAEPVQSQVVVYGDQPYAQNWFMFAADACSVFDQSVSSLQHVLADAVNALVTSILSGGAEIIEDQLDDRTSALAAESNRIVAHDALDAIARDDHEVNSRLIDADNDPAFAAAVSMWLEGVGSKVRRLHAGVMELAPRPRPQVPFSVEIAMSRWVGRPLGLTRSAAVEHRVPILRAGHPLADTIAAHLEADDRGVAFAFFRPTRNHWPPTPIFRVDLLVLPMVGEDLLRIAAEVGLGAWLAQFVDVAMPPVVERIYLGANGIEAADAWAERPYDKREGDRNLSSRPDLFERLTAHLDWATSCRDAGDAAVALASRRPSIVTTPATAARDLTLEVQRRERRTRARKVAGLEADAPEAWTALADATPDRLGHDLRVLGCGVVLFGDPAHIEDHP